MMKTLEYILNATYYGCYLFVRKTDFMPGKDRHFIEKGLGLFWNGSIGFYLLSIVVTINRLLGIHKTLPFWMVLCIFLIVLGIEYYFINRNKKHLAYVRKFMREDRPWKYILIFLLFGMGGMLAVYLSLTVKF